MKDIRMRNRNQIKDKVFFLSKWKPFGRAVPPLLPRLLIQKSQKEKRETEQQENVVDQVQQGTVQVAAQAAVMLKEQKKHRFRAGGVGSNHQKHSLLTILKRKQQEEPSGTDQFEPHKEKPPENRDHNQNSNNLIDNAEKMTINNYGKLNAEGHSGKKIETLPPKKKINGGASVIKTKESMEQHRFATAVKKSRNNMAMSGHGMSQSKKSSGSIAATLKCTGEAIAKAGKSLIGALLSIGGGCVLIVVLCVVLLFAAVLASPMGILYADQVQEPGTILLNMAIAQINAEYAAELERIQDGDYNSIEIHGAPPAWREVVAVFASKTAGANDGLDVLLLDAEKVERLRNVFWDMTSLRAEEEDGVLHIYIEAKSVDDMRRVYLFSRYQNQALDLLLEELDSISSVMGDLTISQEDAIKLLEELPEDLDPLRKAVIEHALSLVGKVNYFWGGKSLVLGWDPRWGTTMQVTSEGSTTTGTYRPFGLDCSGFVDWAFYNATDGEYVLGHGGGTVMQREYCEEISWSEAQPGDLVFYADNSHVGIVGGWNEDGNILIIHCSGSHNNVAISGMAGFGVSLRPNIME